MWKDAEKALGLVHLVTDFGVLEQQWESGSYTMHEHSYQQSFNTLNLTDMNILRGIVGYPEFILRIGFFQIVIMILFIMYPRHIIV